MTPIDPAEGNPILHGVWQQLGEGVHSILYWIDKDNPLGPRPTDPTKDSQFTLWEHAVQLWTGTLILVNAPVGTEPAQNTSAVSPFLVTSPQNGSFHPVGALLTISVQQPVGNPLRKVSYYLNGDYMGATNQAPFSMSVVPTILGPIRIQAVAESVQGVLQATTVVTVQ